MSRTYHHGKRMKFLMLPRWKWWTSPGWWVRLTVTVRKRAQERMLISRQLQDPEQDLAWPLGNRRPHVYYW